MNEYLSGKNLDKAKATMKHMFNRYIWCIPGWRWAKELDHAAYKSIADDMQSKVSNLLELIYNVIL